MASTAGTSDRGSTTSDSIAGSHTPKEAVLAAMQPVVEALGGTLIPLGDITDDDIEVHWAGTVVGVVRLPDPHLDLHNALPTLIAEVEYDMGKSCTQMNRAQKQAVVTLLNERGAFTLRKSVEDVAQALGVSRFTVYNYLERAESDQPRNGHTQPDQNGPTS
ncbi:MAG: helix-turn-helix domain-containing protein [Acidimicrobiales bacterium]|nr:helix-turn-helix domain-containing protein [Acidimicrobiales bacterium]